MAEPAAAATPRLPAAVEVLPADAPRDQWLAARRAGVGSSDIAALLGLSTWESAFALWHRKTGGLGEQDETERMRWGRRLEAAVAEEFAERHPEFTLGAVGLCRSTVRPYQQATPDRLIYDTPRQRAGVFEPWDEPGVGLLEAKTSESWDGWGPDGSDQIPVYYRAQVIWQADCLGYPGVHVAALLPGKRYREYYVPHDEADASLMRQAAVEFMVRVAAGRPPPLDGHTATLTAVKTLNPDVDDEEREVPASIARDWAAACKALKRAEARKRAAEARLRTRMGRARWAVHNGQKVATRSVYEVREHIRAASKVDKLVSPKEKST